MITCKKGPIRNSRDTSVRVATSRVEKGPPQGTTSIADRARKKNLFWNGFGEKTSSSSSFAIASDHWASFTILCIAQLYDGRISMSGVLPFLVRVYGSPAKKTLVKIISGLSALTAPPSVLRWAADLSRALYALAHRAGKIIHGDRRQTRQNPWSRRKRRRKQKCETSATSVLFFFFLFFLFFLFFSFFFLFFFLFFSFIFRRACASRNFPGSTLALRVRPHTWRTAKRIRAVSLSRIRGSDQFLAPSELFSYQMLRC